MTAARRTMVGVLLFVPLAAILLVTFACLPVAVGDPATSKVDERLTGAWKLVPKEATENVALAVLRPMDEHTWFMQYMASDNGKYNVVNYRAWLTPIGGATFITCEALDDSAFLTPAEGAGGGGDSDRYFFVAKIEVKDDMVNVAQLSEDFPALKELKDRAKIEAVIKANVENKDMYTAEVLTFKKLGKEEVGTVSEMRKKAGVGLK